MNFFIIFTLVIAMFLGVNEALWHKALVNWSDCKKNQAIIRNELGPGRSLQYHCHSNGKDQGVQFLKFNEQRNFEYEHSLLKKKNELKCVLRQGLWMQSSSRDFQAYHASRENPCGQVREWIARNDGIYFQRNGIKPAAFVFPWIKKP
ncbi:hypothetical protein Bca4012_008743 [Brassica carinata]